MTAPQTAQRRPVVANPSLIIRSLISCSLLQKTDGGIVSYAPKGSNGASRQSYNNLVLAFRSVASSLQ
jgi:acetylglutamate synthase